MLQENLGPSSSLKCDGVQILTLHTLSFSKYSFHILTANCILRTLFLDDIAYSKDDQQNEHYDHSYPYWFLQ